jgi:glycosyltransferase involved in cell wall biosynthesis
MSLNSFENASTLYIHAANVHHGGGASLLSALLVACSVKCHVIVTLDSRMILPDTLPRNIEFKRVPANILARLKIEFWLRKQVKSQDIVFCFGNLPPLLQLPGKVTVMMQNRYLIDYSASLTHFPLKTKLRLQLERIWVKFFTKNVDEFVVQLPSMKNALVGLGCLKKQLVHTIPFIDNAEFFIDSKPINTRSKEKRFDFIYVASGDPQKNHRKLIDAWVILAQENIFPTLCLTISETASVQLWDWISELISKYGLKVINIGFLPHKEILATYAQARCLVYPSVLESFGMPLLEARQAGLDVIAAELDYVRDLIEPEESFDPTSAVSIARAVRRYMGIKGAPVKVLSPRVFLNELFDQ